mgnify:CR=1 FL=1
MSQSLLIIGPDIELRGVGGVTIHVRRLRDYLKKLGIEHEFRDYKSNSLWTLCRAISKHRIVHVHISNPVYQIVVVLLCRIYKKDVVVTIHGDYGRFGKFKNWLVKRSIKSATVPIVINEKSFEACKNFNNRIALIPAFIPPQEEESLQPEAKAIFEGFRKEKRQIFVTNASNVSVDKFGNEIYGIDFLIEYFKDLEDKALVISDPSGNYKKKYHELLTSSICFINYPHSFYEVLKRADFSIRNTSTDGDALSVRESLYLGVPTLCSDAVDRPHGVKLFKYCDKSSFERCLTSDKSERVIVENGAEKIVNIYNGLWS